LRIGIDLMGSDNSPEDLFPSILHVAHDVGEDCILVVLCHDNICRKLKQKVPTTISEKIQFITAEEIVKMDDAPLLAVRRKKKSSMALGMRLLNSGEIQAFVSTGNTGALVANAAMTLRKLPGIKRLALLATFPTKKGNIAVLDVGACVGCKSKHLVQFACMGTAYQTSNGINKPRIGLLNIGTEEKKGTKELRQAYAALQEKIEISFIGNVEAREVFEGNVDVLVTDGFTGNIFLKALEGTSEYIMSYLKEGYLRGFLSSDIRNKFHYASYSGAILCGVEGVVVKCHGNSTVDEMSSGINKAISLVHEDFVGNMKKYLQYS
jgi:phosphate acyltransferase